jgi:hypothetical protein
MALAERFAEWQIDYLSALRSVDLSAATTLVEELETAVDGVSAGISVSLQTVASWGSTEIDQFGTTLRSLAGQLP